MRDINDPKPRQSAGAPLRKATTMDISTLKFNVGNAKADQAEYTLMFFSQTRCGLSHGVSPEARREAVAAEARRLGSLEAVKALFDELATEFRNVMSPATREINEYRIDSMRDLLTDAMTVLETQPWRYGKR